MLDSLHRLLRRIVERDTLLDENEWEALRHYDFIDTNFLYVPYFMDKTEIRAKAMRVAKPKNDVEKSKRQIHQRLLHDRCWRFEQDMIHGRVLTFMGRLIL